MAEYFSWGLQEGWRKGPWTPQEDKLLTEYVSLHGEGRWSSVASFSGLNRSGKSCRLRWVNYLRPDLKRGKITPREENIIIELHAKLGNRWSTIARSLPGRTDNEIKNYWRTHFKQKGNSLENKKKKNNGRILKIQQQQLQQQQQHQQEGDMKRLGSLLEERKHIASVAQGGQEMLFMYPTYEEQCLSSMLSVDNDAGASPPPDAPSEIGFGLWDALWNLGDFHIDMNMCASNQGVQTHVDG